MTTDLSPLWELRKQSDEHLRQFCELRTKETEIMRQLSETSEDEPVLGFDDQLRLLSWATGKIQLPEKEYRIVKTIWQGESHAANITDIEESVWSDDVEKGMCVDRHTVCARVLIAQKRMRNAACPFKISVVKVPSSREIQGWHIVPANRIEK